MSDFSLMPHQVAIYLGISLEESKQALESLLSKDGVRKDVLIYHNCCEAPIGVMSNFPLVCPNCGEEIAKENCETDLIYFFDCFFFEDAKEVYQLIKNPTE